MKRLAEISLKGQPGAFAGSLMNSSADLVARACEGDQEAFRLIFERYSRPLISFVYDQVGNRELAEELTQETFVRAYRGLHTLRAETKLSTWLFGIAKNVARESLRARQRTNQQIDLDDKLVLNLSDRGPVPVKQLLNKELNEVIQNSLALLEEDIDGEAIERDAAQVSAHLITCAACAHEFETLTAEREVYARYDREVAVSPALWNAIA